ncbi:MAG TPA: response regulator [Polyangiaceae bacterium]|nr:response regulator [Polyangiaceae bacterium]
MAESAAETGGTRQAPRVLVVDDDADSAELLALFLSKKGYEVTTASLLGDARSMLEQGGFDALLTDVRLPDGVGEELLARPGRGSLRAAFIVSGLCGDADIARWRALGFDGHFLKPLSLDRLAKAMAERLSAAR